VSQSETDLRFLGLVLAWHAAGLQQLGKMADPRTGQVEQDLAAARQTIELLETLESKTQGNLSAEEEKTLREVLTFLRLNFVDETRRRAAQERAGADDGAARETPPAADKPASGEPAADASGERG
jgi:hypothetical protein